MSYDAIAKQGKNRNKQLIQTSLSDMKGKEVDEDAVQLPSEKEVHPLLTSFHNPT